MGHLENQETQGVIQSESEGLSMQVGRGELMV